MFCRASLKCLRYSYSSFLMSWFCWGKVLSFVSLSFASISFFPFLSCHGICVSQLFCVRTLLFYVPFEAMALEANEQGMFAECAFKRLLATTILYTAAGLLGRDRAQWRQHNNKPCLGHRQAEHATCGRAPSVDCCRVQYRILNTQHSDTKIT